MDILDIYNDLMDELENKPYGGTQADKFKKAFSVLDSVTEALSESVQNILHEKSALEKENHIIRDAVKDLFGDAAAVNEMTADEIAERLRSLPIEELKDRNSLLEEELDKTRKELDTIKSRLKNLLQN